MSLSTQMRLDDLGVGAFQRDLEYREQKVMEKKYPQLKFAEGLIVPIEELDIPWAETTSYRMITGVGAFELARDYTTNLPMVDILSEEFIQRTYKYVGGYYYNEDEAYKSVHLNMPIEDQKIGMVRRVAMQTMNKLIAFGDRETGQSGFVNHPGWLRSVAPYPLDATSTANQQLTTLTSATSAIVTVTNGEEMPDTMLLPLEKYEFAINSRLDNTLEKTVLRQFLDNNGHVTDIQPLNELKGAGPNGEDVMIIFRRDPEAVKYRVTQPFGFRDLFRMPFGFQRPSAFKTGGIIPYLPYSVHLVIGI